MHQLLRKGGWNDYILENSLGKGMYPYEYMDDISKLNETDLPSIKFFYSSLTGEASQQSYDDLCEIY